MKPDAIDRELQEFLDGRMTEEQRVAFENRLARDRDLARRVATGQEIRRVLRAGDEQVSPGFYTRARARFEAGRRGRDWFRLLSWETAGLAAAVAVAAVLFVPSLFVSERPGGDLLEQREPPAASRPTPAGSADAPAEETAGETEPARSLAAEGSEPRRGRGEPQGGKQAAADVAELKAEDATRRRVEIPGPPPERYAPAPPPPSPDDAGKRTTISRPEPPDAEPRAAEPPAASVPLEKQQRSSLSERAEPGEPSAAPAVEFEEPAGAQPPRAGTAVEAESTAAPLGHAMASPAVGAEWPAFELPQGAVGRGEVRTLRTAEELARLDRLTGGRVTASGGLRAGTRVVLVGARVEPFSCSGLSAMPIEDRYVIRLRATYDSQAAASWGCAIVIPDDGRSVAVMGPAGPESDE